MEHYLIDTNAISDYFTASFSKKGISLMDKVINEVPNLSIITQIELLCWQTDTKIMQMVVDFIDDSNVFNINQEIIKQCVAIRRNKKIKTPDAIIGATAVAYQFTLITNNEKDFNDIKGLKILNPMKI